MKRFFVNRMLNKWEARNKELLAAQKLPAGIKEITGIPYAGDKTERHTLDAYYPEGAQEKLPAVVYIHGGGFLYGYKELNKLFCCRLAEKGFIVFNINYRLAPDEAKVPGQIKDVMDALLWVERNARGYPADISRVCLAGDSAGGFLAVMAALICKSPRLQKICGVSGPAALRVKAVGVISGLLNIETKSVAYWGMRSMCLDKGYKNQEYYKNYIFESLPETAQLPPVFMSTSDEDELRQMTLNFEATLKKRNVPYKLKYQVKKPERKLGHVFPVMYPDYEESRELIAEMAEFFNSPQPPLSS